jgi:L-fuconolactonase
MSVEPASIPIVDTHVHVVSADLRRYPRSTAPTLSGDVPPWWEAAHPVEALLGEMNASQVDYAVVVQAFGPYGFDNRCAVDSTDSAPARLASVVAVDPASPGAAQELTGLVSTRRAAGLRLLVRPDMEPAIGDLVACAAELDIPVCLLVPAPEQLEPLTRLVNRFPATVFVIEHLAAATRTWGIPEQSVAALRAFAARPNVYLKVSTVNLAPIAGAPDPIVGLARLRDMYAASRLMWGSNYPASEEFDLSEMVRLAMTAVGEWSRDDQSLFLAGTARTLWPALGAKPPRDVATS